MNASATLPVVRTKGLSILGITGFPTVANGFTGIPSLYVSGYTSPYQLPESQPTEETFQYIDQVTYERGARTIKAGVEYRPMAFGSFSYSSQYTGNAYADFLLGLPDTTGYTYTRTPEYARYWFLNSFVQDDWNVRPNLTVLLGVRYEYDSPPMDKNNVVASFDPYPRQAVSRESETSQFKRWQCRARS